MTTTSSYWQVKLNSVAVFADSGDKNISVQYNAAVFDSGASLVYVPSSDYTQLYKYIVTDNSNSCSLDQTTGMTYCTCSSNKDLNFPKVGLKMGGRYTFYMNGSDYLVYDATKKQCILVFVKDTTSKFWLLGDPFIRAYFMIFDMDNL